MKWGRQRKEIAWFFWLKACQDRMQSPHHGKTLKHYQQSPVAIRRHTFIHTYFWLHTYTYNSLYHGRPRIQRHRQVNSLGTLDSIKKENRKSGEISIVLRKSCELLKWICSTMDESKGTKKFHRLSCSMRSASACLLLHTAALLSANCYLSCMRHEACRQYTQLPHSTPAPNG